MMRHIKKGFDLLGGGLDERNIEGHKRVSKVALTGPDFLGMRPTMKVQVGSKVKIGDPLFECKKTPGVLYTSIGAGVVTAIKRGEKRAFQTVEIELAKEETHRDFVHYKNLQPSALSRENIVGLMVESGLWTSLRMRPYSKIPPPDSSPHSIFVTAMDTNPLSVSPCGVIARYARGLSLGIEVLTHLTEGSLHIVKKAGTSLEVPSGKKIHVHEFSGVHPAGNVGTHIHFIDPVSLEKSVWYVGYQDVIAIGKLFETGKLFVERTISLAGPGIQRSRVVTTRLGANLDELVEGEVGEGNIRVISGSLLNGRSRDDVFCYLGRYHNQVSLLPEGSEREFLGWFFPKKVGDSTNMHGSLRAIVPIGKYESVMPLDILPTLLLRSLAARDSEGASELGALELDEEDLSLCTFVCPSKIDYGTLLRENLELIEREG